MPAKLSNYIDVVRLVWAAVLALLVGCGSAAGPTCAPGTEKQGSQCVATSQPLVCGAGTALINGQCVATADAGGDVAADDASDATVDQVGGSDIVEDTGATDDAVVDTDGGAEDAVVEVVDDTAQTDDAAQEDGTLDSDAGDSSNDVPVGCNPKCGVGEICTADGICVADPAIVWNCLPFAKGDGAQCDCECGAPDPDCADPNLPVVGCLSGKCQADGTCAPCVADCTNKECGGDGCGGSCGTCLDPTKPACFDGLCEATCTPICTNKACGDDGCGGICGVCGPGEVCNDFACVTLGQDYSCSNYCNGKAPSGCSCELGCAALGTCCADIDSACTCLANCVGKGCGDDGCGGSCGPCNDGEQCQTGKCVDDPCTPDPCGGNGACDSTTGACICLSKFQGADCSQCAGSLVDYPNCTENLCLAIDAPCSGHGACQPIDGSCDCVVGFTGAACDACVVATATWPDCDDPCANVDCNDDNPCTDDSCDASGTCVHATNAEPCDDADPCTGADVCDSGTCAGSKQCDIAVTSADDADDGNCTASHCSLREAIQVANQDPGLTVIGFAVDATITLGSPLPVVSQPAGIHALTHAVAVNGDNAYRIFDATADLSLEGLTLAHGKSNSGGAVRVQGAVLTATRVRMSDNTSTADGGALWLGGAATLYQCDLQSNLAAAGGGAVYCGLACDVTITQSSLVGNSASLGGALSADGNARLGNTTVATNTASTAGGAIYANGDVSLVHCTLLDNTSVTASAIWSTTVSILNSLVVVTVSTAPSCGANAVATTGSWLADDSCGSAVGAAFGTLSLVSTTWGEAATFDVNDILIDQADSATCALPIVGGVDQQGTQRPEGAGCDVGAFEWKAP